MLTRQRCTRLTLQAACCVLVNGTFLLGSFLTTHSLYYASVLKKAAKVAASTTSAQNTKQQFTQGQCTVIVLALLRLLAFMQLTSKIVVTYGCRRFGLSLRCQAEWLGRAMANSSHMDRTRLPCGIPFIMLPYESLLLEQHK